MILSPCRLLGSWEAGCMGTWGWGGGGGGQRCLCGMPELNSHSPPSNRPVLTPATCPAQVVMVARCFPHTHYTLAPSEGSTQAATLSPSVALLCLTLPVLHLSPPPPPPLPRLPFFCLFNSLSRKQQECEGGERPLSSLCSFFCEECINS